MPFFDLSASAGGGTQIDLASETEQDPDNQWVFPRQWLAKLGRRQTDALRMISISGGLMRYISSGVWYGLRVAYNEAF